MASSITTSVFAEETAVGTKICVDAGNDTQEKVGTTSESAEETEEPDGGTTNNVDANNGNDTQEKVGTTSESVEETEETDDGTTICEDEINGDVPQEDVGTTSDKAYRTLAAAAAPANSGATTTIYVDEGDGTEAKAYKTLAEAVAAAKSGATIQLGEGNYTLYGVSSEGHTKGKSLTFVGQGTNTKWQIGPETPDPKLYGTEYNGDYSFDGAGTITFKNMTLRSGSVDYLGFIRADKTVVENCTINGKTDYWGYKSATFTNCIFNCPQGQYALWTYCSPVMTFNNCTFNSSGKVINVYTDGSHDITVNFNGCTVNNTRLSFPLPKPVLNINDSNMGNYKYVINISGNNVVNRVDVDKDTCSRLFGFGRKAATNNTGRTIVKFGNTTVWQDGKMVDAKAYHNSGVTVDGVTYTNDVDGSNVSLYAEGYKDNAFDIKTGEWTTDADGKISRKVTKTCKYCGYQEIKTEYPKEPTPEPAPGTAPESTPETTPASYGTVHLYKVDGQTGAKLQGAEFSLYKDNGEYVGSYTTDPNGGITVYNILYGSYYFTETKAPDGYTLDPTHVKFTLESAEMNVKFSNTAAAVPTMLVGGIKTWNDNNNAAGARPSSITLHLFANGVEVGTTQATADTNWQYAFGAQPINDANGKAIVYSLSEDEVSGYNTEISEPVTADNAMVINVTNTYRTVATTTAGIATGDDSNMALYGLLSLIAGAGLVGLFMRRRLF
ncbi:MAG: Cna B-type domain-containing protein [Firmicutes bacterium]|nr:Cna B-type domain-containing protein [Bacillota bacterium]